MILGTLTIRERIRRRLRKRNRNRVRKRIRELSRPTSLSRIEHETRPVPFFGLLLDVNLNALWGVLWGVWAVRRVMADGILALSCFLRLLGIAHLGTDLADLVVVEYDVWLVWGVGG
jgi:hypothetical protein